MDSSVVERAHAAVAPGLKGVALHNITLIMRNASKNVAKHVHEDGTGLTWDELYGTDIDADATLRLANGNNNYYSSRNHLYGQPQVWKVLMIVFGSLLACLFCLFLAYKLAMKLCPLHMEVWCLACGGSRTRKERREYKKAYANLYGPGDATPPDKRRTLVSDSGKPASLDMLLGGEGGDDDDEEAIDLRLRAKSMPALKRASLKAEDRLTRKSLVRLHKVRRPWRLPCAPGSDTAHRSLSG